MKSYCVIHDKGFKILDYNTLKQNHDDSVVHFIGTYKECLGFIARSNAAQELINSVNREHAIIFASDNTRTASENHFDFSEFCNANNLSLEDNILYVFEEKGVATPTWLTVNALEQELYSLALEECEFKPKQAQRKTYTREEVYMVAQRSVHAVINNLLTDNRTRTMQEVINSEIDTVKLF